jgi:hypothetical protein
MKRIGSIFCAIACAFPILGLQGQNVGIGTSQPLTKLHIVSEISADGLLIDNVGINGDPTLQFGINGMPVLSMGIDDSDGDKFKLGTSSITSNTRLTIQSNGYLGIGTTSPAYHLHVTSARAGDYVAYFQNGNDQGGALVGYAGSTVNAVGAVTDNEAGLAGYAVHLPATGNGWAMWATSNSSDAIAVRGSIPTNGSWLGYAGYFAGGIGYVNGLYNLSDTRAKKNVATLSGALDKVMQLRGVTYQYDNEAFGKYTGNDSRTYTGFVAQEVERIVPEAVAEKYIVSDGTEVKGAIANMNSVERQTVKVVDYVSLVPVLVEAMKEQQAEIQRLNQKIQELEAQH